MKRLLPLLLIVVTLAACTKNNDNATTNVEKEQQLSGKTWVGTTASTSTQQISLNTDKSFSLQLNSVDIPGYNIVVNVTGNWAVEGDNIVMTNTKATVFNNGNKIENLQTFITSTGCNCYEVVKAALNSSSLLLQVDGSGNFSLKDSSGNTVKFYIKNFDGKTLTLTYNGVTYNFTLKTN